MSFFGIQLNVQLNRLMLDIRLHLAENKYIPNIRTLYTSFVNFDPHVTGLLSGLSFEKALNSNGIFMKKYDIQVFEKAYNQNGKINWFDFLHHLKEPMSPSRRSLVEKIFDSMDKDHAGKLQTQDLMAHFNYNEIETYRYGKKSKEQIGDEFLSMLHLQEGFVTREEFISFYDDLNINFGHNDIFVRYLSTQWFQTPEKMQEVREEEIKKYVLLLRNRLLERTQASKNDLLILKLFKEFDVNGNSYLGGYDVDLMLKNLGVTVEPRLVEQILSRIDKSTNQGTLNLMISKNSSTIIHIPTDNLVLHQFLIYPLCFYLSFYILL